MNRRALTLVETLVVILIILILLGLLLTAVAWAFKAAKDVNGEAQEQQQRTSDLADEVSENR